MPKEINALKFHQKNAKEGHILDLHVRIMLFLPTVFNELSL